MADVLKTTNWWSANPPAGTIVNVSGAVATEAVLIAAADAHDANDATGEQFNVQGDGVSINGSANLTQVKTLTAASGGIKFLRLKWRGRTVISGSGSPSGAGSVTPYADFGGGATPIGIAQALTNAYANYTLDLLNHPLTGLPWTAAQVNGTAFGYRIDASADSATFLGLATTRIVEFTVEVWGQDVTGGTVGVIGHGLVAATADAGGAFVPAIDPRDPTAVVAIGSTLDQTSNLVTVRSFKASLNDQSNLTKDTFTSPASWPNSGTQTQPLYGSGTQGVQGDAAAGNGIQGTDAISGIKLFATVRVSKSATATAPTNVRFGTTMGVKALVSGPTVRDIAALNDTMWEVVQTALITTGQFGNPFTWGNDVDSVWASLFGWTFNHTYSNASNPMTTQVEVAEAWIEIYGPVGAQPVLIELSHSLGLPVKQQALEGTF